MKRRVVKKTAVRRIVTRRIEVMTRKNPVLSRTVIRKIIWMNIHPQKSSFQDFQSHNDNFGYVSIFWVRVNILGYVLISWVQVISMGKFHYVAMYIEIKHFICPKHPQWYFLCNFNVKKSQKIKIFKILKKRFFSRFSL